MIENFPFEITKYDLIGFDLEFELNNFFSLIT
jgi:hypothetical protein